MEQKPEKLSHYIVQHFDGDTIAPIHEEDIQPKNNNNIFLSKK